MNITAQVLTKPELARSSYEFWHRHTCELQMRRKRCALAGEDEDPILLASCQLAEVRLATARFEWMKATKKL